MRSKPVDSLFWEKLYADFTAPVASFDCGTLCAPHHGGIPRCCDHDEQLPLLFHEELRWLRKQGNQWRKRRALTPEEKKEDAVIEDYIVYAHCSGIASCDRGLRSLACRFFPFEAYFDERGRFAGITWIYRARDCCPLIGYPSSAINSDYVRQSCEVWNRIFDRFPRERELYREESKKLRRRWKARGEEISVFS